MARTENRKRGAAPRNTDKGGGKGGSRSGGKGWPLFIAGLGSGLVLAGGVYLASILPTAMDLREKARAHEADCAALAEKPKKVAAGTEAATDGKKPVTFEFYSMLPQQEVVAPVNGNKTTTATPPPVPPAPPAPAATAATAPAPATPAATTPAAGSGRYLLQAGSFRTRPEADRRRGELLLSGHNVSVQEGKTANGDTWFRVMVGPFTSDTDMQKARQQLAARKIETMPIRVK